MKKYIFIIIIWLLIIIAGFIKISSELPDFIKARSNVQVTLNEHPFDLKLETSKYRIYINTKAMINIKNNIKSMYNFICYKVVNTKNYIWKSFLKFDFIQHFVNEKAK